MKNKTQLKHIIHWLKVGILTAFVSHLMIELLQNVGFTQSMLSVPLFLLGTVVLFILYLFFSSLLGSSTIGGILLLVTAFVLGLINRIKHHYRAEPLIPNDLAIVKEVPFLIEMVGWPIAILIGVTILAAIIFLYIFYTRKIKPKQKAIPKRLRWSARLIGCFLAISSLFYIGQFHTADNLVHQLYNKHASWTYEDQLKNYQDNGFIAGFLSNLASAPMKEPANYSKETIKQLLDKYKEKANTRNHMKDEPKVDTNVLFVMNESFSDPLQLEGIESNKDPLAQYREIAQNTLSGYAISPTFGGGTNANEFQALTGFSLEPLNPPFTSPYMQLDERMGNYPSIVKRMNQLNYQTTAIHPYDPQFFKRDEIYPKMTFDEFLHQDNMNHREKVTDEHLYISDHSTYKEALEVMKASKETDFIHIVTMQNHTPYADKYEQVDYQVTGSGNAEEANAYFEDLEQSDQALKKLIDQIDAHDEPILLLFWGDHLPGLYRGEVRESNSELTLRQTPFFVYSNSIKLEGNHETITPNYMQQEVYHLLDIKLSPYDALLSDLEARLPMIDKGIYYEARLNQLYTKRGDLTEDTLEVLEDYTLLMYDVTTGNNYADDVGFFEVSE